jgi:hypothetical protein
MATAFLFSIPVHARVGETEKEITARYGEGKKADNQRLAGAVTSAYKKDEFDVEVVLLNGKSVMEIYAHKKGMTEDVIKELLKVNTEPGTAWLFRRKTNRWERSGTPQLVAHRWPDHPDFFCIKDLKAHDNAIAKASLITQLVGHAKIGETQKEIVARYGEGKKAETQRLVGAETFAYTSDDCYVEVAILEGKSALEIFAPKGGATEAVIKDLLQMNTIPGTAWRFDKKANQWERSGSPKLVAYKWPGHPEFFCIKDLKACEEAEKKHKPNTSGL